MRLVLESLLVICGFSSLEPGVFCATFLPFVQRLLARAETPKKTAPLVRVVWHANAVVLTKKSELAGALPVGAVRRAADGRVIAHLYEVQASFERAVLQLAQNGSPPPRASRAMPLADFLPEVPLSPDLSEDYDG